MFYIRSKSSITTWTVMGHIQQLAFALGPIGARPAAPARPRPAGRPDRSVAAVAQPLLPEVAPPAPPAPAEATEPAAVIAPEPPPAPSPPAAVPPSPAIAAPLSDDMPSPVKAALYVVIGFARGRERRRGGWHRLAEQGFASRRLAEEHAARLLARGRTDGVILARQELRPDPDAAEEPVILARLGELPAELAEG